MSERAAGNARKSTTARKPKSTAKPYVNVRLPLSAEMLAQVDELCDSCKPLPVPRERMLRILIQTGLLYWGSGSRKRRTGRS